MSPEMIYCFRCLREFPDDDFDGPPGSRIHRVEPRHYESGELVDPPDLPDVAEEEEE
ncbi:MAG: hypothetical protein GTO14_10570 [Anaerolineales bacterium]|nr:hypothetical protein [Anaerolineales bacterium]